MPRNYTLKEIKEELQREIDELYRKDPYWKKCLSCPFKGRCCEENDIDIREDEWEEISSFLAENPEVEKKVYENYLFHSRCYFHTSTCCLIAPIRPTNCLYTPYQLIQNLYDHTLEYNKPTEECTFETIEVPSKELPLTPYLIQRGERTYLFLNYWFENFENQSEGTYKETGEERLKEYFTKKGML